MVKRDDTPALFAERRAESLAIVVLSDSLYRVFGQLRFVALMWSQPMSS